MTEATTTANAPIQEGRVEEVKVIDVEKTANILFGDTKQETKEVPVVKTEDAKDEKKDATDTKVEDSKADDTKKEEAPKEVEFTDFKLPEGYVADPELTGEFKAVAKALKLTQEQAQSLVDMQTKLATKQSTAMHEQWANTQKDWRAKSESDKEFGGTSFKANVGIAKTALDKFGTKEFREAIENTGMGNHPELIRFLYKVGKSISEDKINTTGVGTKGPRDIARVLFPDQK